MKLFQIDIQNESQKTILKKVDGYLSKPGPMRHIVSLNAENLISSETDEEFRLILQSGDVKLIDGAGVAFAIKLRSKEAIERITGVDFMQELLKHVGFRSLRALFIGGKDNLAKELAECYNQKASNVEFFGISGIKNIKTYQEAVEGKKLLQEITAIKPHLIFIAFGSPFQEKWLWNHRDQLKGIVCMGVGGSFDFISGRVARAPQWVRTVGFEWLFRLVTQPWRWRRQLRLLTFVQRVTTGEAYR